MRREVRNMNNTRPCRDQKETRIIKIESGYIVVLNDQTERSSRHAFETLKSALNFIAEEIG